MKKTSSIPIKAHQFLKMLFVVFLFNLSGCKAEKEDRWSNASNSNRVSEPSEEQAGENASEGEIPIDDSNRMLSGVGNEPLAQKPEHATGWVLSQVSNPNTRTAVTIEHGTIEGGVSSDGQALYWLGVPYAAPPMDTAIHKRRWRAPQDPEAWPDTLPTTEFTSHCIQVGLLYDLTMDINGSEDCLYINVWRPNTDESSLPVLFWIHGGGFQFEDASMGAYNGANFATNQNVIVVTLDYRLGYLGWLYHKALHGSGTTEQDRSGNFALLDVIKALKWVHENIEQFGGDRDNITIAGQSAGGAFVLALMASPMVGNEYFHRAILQSSPVAFGETVGFTNQANAETAANTLIHNLLMDNGSATTLSQAETLLGQMDDTQVEQLLRDTDAKTLVELAWER